MSDFLTGLRSGSTASPAEATAKKEEVMAAVRNELAKANAQTLMNNANERCFKVCVTKPGSSLSSSEETCLARCLDRFMDVYNITSKSYISRLARERAAEGQPDTLTG
ncbi:Tim10/DDP family zinc finger-domain-containing protein [Mycena floridula]|nr:Tim10/DDP family zinc finger-domain-containing protein [Mycena floridula]